MAIGDQVRAAREARDLSQSQLAALTGLDQSGISAIEHGRRVPGAEVLGRLADALDAEFVEEPPVTEEPRVFSTDEAPKAKKTTTAKKTSGPKHAARSGGGLPLQVQLEFPYMILSNATANRLPQTSRALAEAAGPCAAAWDNFLMRYPALREKIEQGMIAGDIVALIMAHLPIIQAAREETQRLQEQQAWDAGATPAAA